jgi:tetratricopeptide (TPR) repeat protein
MTVANAALVFAACDDPSQAQPFLEQLQKQYPKSTISASIIAPMVRAEIERSRGNLEQAIQLSESMRSYDFSMLTGPGNNYARGYLFLRLRRGPEAAAEFRKIIDNRSIDAFSPCHALARLGLARAAQLSGDTAQARKSYQDFFAMWKDADQDLPVLVEAKKEYEQLK